MVRLRTPEFRGKVILLPPSLHATGPAQAQFNHLGTVYHVPAHPLTMCPVYTAKQKKSLAPRRGRNHPTEKERPSRRSDKALSIRFTDDQKRHHNSERSKC